MTLELWLRCAYRPALSLLPARMDSEVAAVVILAICLQESELRHRRQMGEGPARGYLQFELIGLTEVFRNPASQAAALALATALDYDYPASPLYQLHHAMEHNDVLSAGIARLALWRHPSPLPTDQDACWGQYVDIWAPGKPRPADWPDSYGRAVEAVLG